MEEKKQPRTQIEDLEEEKELTEDELKKVEGGTLTLTSTPPPDPALIGLLLPAVQKVR